MDPEKLERVKSYSFYKVFVERGDVDSLLSDLRSFKDDKGLGFTEEEVAELEMYVQEREKVLRAFESGKARFKAAIKKGSQKEVYSAIKSFSGLGKLAVFEQVLFPGKASGIFRQIALIFAELERTGYPAQLLEELKEDFQPVLKKK